MGYQVPKKDHPWRQWSGKKYEGDELSQIKGGKEEKKIKPLKIFLREIASSYDKIEVYTFLYGREGRFNLWELPQSRQAAWLAGILKKNYSDYL